MSLEFGGEFRGKDINRRKSLVEWKYLLTFLEFKRGVGEAGLAKSIDLLV